MARNSKMEPKKNITTVSVLGVEFKPVSVTVTIHNAATLRLIQRACQSVNDGDGVCSFASDVDEAVEELLQTFHTALENV